MRSLFRAAISVLAIVFGTGTLSPLIDANWQEWAKTTGNDQYFVNYLGPTIVRLVELTQTGWFVFAAGFFVGGAAWLWLDYLLRGSPQRSASPNYVETTVRFERNRSSPHEFRANEEYSKNIGYAFQLWDFQPMVIMEARFNAPESAKVIINERRATPDPKQPEPKQIDTFVLWFATPTKYSDVQIESFGQAFPRHDIYATTERGIILYVREPIPPNISTFEIRFKK